MVPKAVGAEDAASALSAKATEVEAAAAEAISSRRVYLNVTDVVMAKHLGVTDLAFNELMHYKVCGTNPITIILPGVLGGGLCDYVCLVRDQRFDARCFGDSILFLAGPKTSTLRSYMYNGCIITPSSRDKLLPYASQRLAELFNRQSSIHSLSTMSILGNTSCSNPAPYVMVHDIVRLISFSCHKHACTVPARQLSDCTSLKYSSLRV